MDFIALAKRRLEANGPGRGCSKAAGGALVSQPKLKEQSPAAFQSHHQPKGSMTFESGTFFFATTFVARIASRNPTLSTLFDDDGNECVLLGQIRVAVRRSGGL